MHHPDHLVPLDFKGRTWALCRGSREAKTWHRREGLFAHEFASRQESDGRLFPVLRNDAQPGAPFLKIKDGVGGIALAKESFFRLQFNKAPAQTGIRKESGSRERRTNDINGQSATSFYLVCR